MTAIVWWNAVLRRCFPQWAFLQPKVSFALRFESSYSMIYYHVISGTNNLLPTIRIFISSFPRFLTSNTTSCKRSALQIALNPVYIDFQYLGKLRKTQCMLSAIGLINDTYNLYRGHMCTYPTDSWFLSTVHDRQISATPNTICSQVVYMEMA